MPPGPPSSQTAAAQISSAAHVPIMGESDVLMRSKAHAPCGFAAEDAQLA